MTRQEMSNSYAPLRVLIYSSNSEFRTGVRGALGRVPDRGLAPLEFFDTATQAAVLTEIASGTIDLAILDGEATPSGGIGLAKQLKDELLQYLPIVVITARPDDTWLARWSRADAVMPRPLDPEILRQQVLPLLHGRMLV